MDSQSIDLTVLKKLVKEAVKEAIKEERYNLSKALIPNVSDEEMREIQQTLGVPTDYNKEEFKDISNYS